MNKEINIPEPLAERLLMQAAELEVPAEEIVMEAFKHYMERNENNGN